MPYADLVLEGGGVKGIALVGAISVLEEEGYEFKRVAGTSAGAVVGALVAAGIPSDRLQEIMRSVEYSSFKDASLLERLPVGQAIGVILEQGIYRGDALRSWLADQLKTMDVKTFADLPYKDEERDIPPEQQYKLVVMASDLSQGSLSRLPWEYTSQFGLVGADQKVADAVRASMSIPFFFRPVRWDNPQGEESWLVDGGMLSNFPVDTFDAPSGVEPRWPTFGLKLSGGPEAPTAVDNKIHGPASMTVAMLHTMTGFYDRMHVGSPEVQARTIFIDTGGVRTTDFDLSKSDQEMLYQNGRKAATKFLKGGDGQAAWDFDAYVAKYRNGAATG